MNRKSILLAGMVMVLVLLGLALARSPGASAAPDTTATPIHAGCYLARLNQCKIHVEPFTINVGSGKKLVYFQLAAARSGSAPAVIYNWRPDQSNPAPLSGSTYTPSQVAKDFGGTCGYMYTVVLLGQDTGDVTGHQLGITNRFTCPTATYLVYVPRVRK